MLAGISCHLDLVICCARPHLICTPYIVPQILIIHHLKQISDAEKGYGPFLDINVREGLPTKCFLIEDCPFSQSKQTRTSGDMGALLHLFLALD